MAAFIGEFVIKNANSTIMTGPMRAGIQRELYVSAARNITTRFYLAVRCGTRNNRIFAVVRASAKAIEYHMSPNRKNRQSQ